LLSQRFNQLPGNARVTEPADHDSGAIEHLCHRFAASRHSFVDHVVTIICTSERGIIDFREDPTAALSLTALLLSALAWS
jgi:hypothetical protein